MSDDLREALLGFDGRAISYLSETRVRYEDDANFIPELVALSADLTAHIATGATWLIKDHLDNDGLLAPHLIGPWLRSLTASLPWAATLHILQSVRNLDLGTVNDPVIFDAFRRLIEHEKPFVRAWAADAFWRAASTFDELRPEAEVVLERAANDPAASVRARARQIAKEATR